MIVLLDQENVSHHGLTGIEALTDSDKIITFLGKDCRLSSKLTQILEGNNIPYEIQEGFVGTKNAADYQLVSYLSYLVLEGKEKEFLVLSRDSGFDSSINYLKHYHKGLGVSIFRANCILEYVIMKFLMKELNISHNYSCKIYKALLASRYSNIKEFKMTLEKQGLKQFLFDIIPYFEFLKGCLIEIKVDKTVDNKCFIDGYNTRISKIKTNSDINPIIADILNIDSKKFEDYLNRLKLKIIRSENFNDFCKKVLANPLYLEIGDIKRCDIPKKIKPFYDILKDKLEIF